MTRKEMKKAARRSLKKHYGIFILVCLIAAYIGAEFHGSMNGVSFRIAPKEKALAAGGAVLEKMPGEMDVILEALRGNEKESREIASKLTEKFIEDGKEKNELLGRSRGVFAGIVNKIKSGSFLIPIVSAVNSVTGSGEISMVIFVVLGVVLEVLIWFFAFNVYLVISRRIFLEGRFYAKVPVSQFAYLLRIKRWFKASCTMGLMTVQKMAWSLTIIGGVIKRYSYFLVPYIVAENPDIAPRKAIKLSRMMMYGHKWECFVFEASYWGWGILNLATLGVTGILYSNPYKIAALSEYYVGLRKKAIEEKIEGCEYLNDTYLYEFASDALIKTVYAEDMKDLEGVTEEENPLQGIPGFLADMFSISVMGLEKEREFEAYQIRQIRYKMIEETLEKKTYPNKLSPTPEERKRKKVEHMRYARCYSIWSLTTLFFAFSFVGWLWEVCLALVQEGMFVNRGVLHGPWLPIYGSGAVLILIVLNKFRNKPMIEFFSTIVLCGGVEYFTSWFLEVTKDGQRWWDYSGYFLNLNGRICAEGLLVFGLGGMVIVYVAAPLLDNMVDKVAVKILAPVCIAITVIFAADQIYSFKHPNVGHGITDYAGIRDIEMQGTDMRESIER
ncbi:MAG: DUF975 family protein [Lachnospiraceae bacterium]|nr:DUF975 family protein [Lachnospiraceae bacterium]